MASIVLFLSCYCQSYDVERLFFITFVDIRASCLNFLT